MDTMKLNLFLKQFLPTFLFLGIATNVNAECVKPLANKYSVNVKDWKELYGFHPPKKINGNDINFVQTINGTGSGKINLDYYSITIDKPKNVTMEKFFSDFRKNMSTMIFGKGSAYSLEPYDSSNARIWKSDSPVGAVMSFTLAPVIEKGSVVVSCFDKKSFVFSTVNTDKDGDHPVSGNRVFGINANSDGSWTLFTKAADRIKDNVIHNVIGHETIFKQGHDVWLGLLSNIEDHYKHLHPRNNTINSNRYEYDRRFK